VADTTSNKSTIVPTLVAPSLINARPKAVLGVLALITRPDDRRLSAMSGPFTVKLRLTDSNRPGHSK
jgi:hypothetical protein